MTGNELRTLFIEFFVKHDHRHVDSWPLIPPTDPTLLFTSAGMVPFKPFYSGDIPLPYSRAASSQKCFRAGGKASDLENVGKTLRHLTFFEMLGNFSFGDYFKQEAIQWAWEFCLDILKMPKDKLYVSIYKDDDEAYDIWSKEIGLPDERIIRLGDKDNFWGPAGDTGACGPCTELHYDMGEERSCGKPDCAVGCDCERYFEFWNLVFPQFDQQKDGSRPPLKNRGIDTGMGLERLACIVQNKDSLFETDLLFPIVKATADILDIDYKLSQTSVLSSNVIADHIRGLVFTLSEGIVPSNEGRGYVLRRILRRASRHGKKLGADKPFLHELVTAVVDAMGDAYPEIKENPEQVKKVVRLEEERFHRTLAQGIEILDGVVASVKNDGHKILPGDEVFRLYDTYGFPVELTKEIAEEQGLDVDETEFERCLNEQRERAKKSWKGAELGDEANLLEDVFAQYGPTNFVGYEQCTTESTLIALIKNNRLVDSISSGDEATLVLEETSFYSEAGGQVGDKGTISSNSSDTFAVNDTQKTPSEMFLHRGILNHGTLKVGDIVRAEPDRDLRLDTMRNHTATHLLQGALRLVIGTHITQSGSFVTPDALRFDFTHLEALTPQQIEEVETIVNEKIIDNLPLNVTVMPREKAKSQGAIAPFGEKYGDEVRVVQIADFSKEFCGGTHLSSTGQIGSFLILSESSIASGIRRIEAITGKRAFHEMQKRSHILSEISRTLSTNQDELIERVNTLLKQTKDLQKEQQQLRQKITLGSVDDIIADAKEISGIRIITHQFDNLGMQELRNVADAIRSKIPKSVVVLGSISGDKVQLLCACGKDAKDKVNAQEIVKAAANEVGGSGGGRPDLAQAGGKLPDKLPSALSKAGKLISEILAQ